MCLTERMGEPGGAVAAPPTGAIAGTGELFQLLRDGRARTRAELAACTGLARSTVAARVDALLASGLVGHAGEATSTGGRPPTRFRFDPAVRVVLGADLGATHARLAVTDLAGSVLAEVNEDLDIALGPDVGARPRRHAGPRAARAVGVDAARRHRRRAARDRSSTRPDARSTRRSCPAGTASTCPATSPPSSARRLLVDNDVNVMALGEHFAHWPGTAHLMLVKVATGIGSGIISDGALRRARRAPPATSGTSPSPAEAMWRAAAATPAAWRPSPPAPPWPRRCAPAGTTRSRAATS